MKWLLKKSTAKSAKTPCVIKIEKTNLTGSFMGLTNLGNNEYSFSPSEIGLYRIMHNSDRSKKSTKGCYIVYQLDNETFLRYLNISDEEVRTIDSDDLKSEQFANKLAQDKKAKYEQ